MKISRRQFLTLLGGAGVGALTWRYWPDEGFINPCLTEAIPDHLRKHELYQSLWDGIDPLQYWDVHTHLVGTGDSGSGAWITPRMQSLLHPTHHVRYRFYMNAACADPEQGVDNTYVERLLHLHAAFPAGTHFMLLAFAYLHDEQGQYQLDRSALHIPNQYASQVAQRHPDVFEWIASIHPYHPDSLIQLEQVAAAGAKAIKWVPQVMGIDPASPRCDRFYEGLVKYNLPLLTHSGDEHAVGGVESQAGGNPLLLRRALEHGVRVIMAHSACEGHNVDLDKGKNGPIVSNFELFSRMMDESRYEKLLYGDISATTQVNHIGLPLETLVNRTDWHTRLLNGSDYPLPAVMPVFSLKRIQTAGYISSAQAAFLSELRRYNAMLFDFALKRLLQVNGKQFSSQVFETRHLFTQQQNNSAARQT